MQDVKCVACGKGNLVGAIAFRDGYRCADCVIKCFWDALREKQRLMEEIEQAKREIRYRDMLIAWSPGGDRFAPLVAEIEKLRKVLEPFAICGAWYEEHGPRCQPPEETGLWMVSGPKGAKEPKITVRHVLDAKTALEER